MKKTIVIIMMLISFQTAASDSCFKEKYLPGINNCIKEKIESNQVKLTSEYQKIENHFKSSEDHESYLKDMQKNRQEWTEVTTKFCDLQSYFVDKETITYEIQFNQCINEKIKHQTSEISNLYQIISSMM